MFLIREKGKNTGNEYLTEFKNDSSREKGNLLFFPGAGGAHYFHAMGFPERDTIYWAVDNFISPDKNFIDIGAHVGSYTLPCGVKAKHTYAFECTPKTFCYLAANIALHGLEYKITPFSYALGDKEGTADIFIRSEDGGGNGIYQIEEKDSTRTRVKVNIRTLDSFHLDNIGFIKMDVEGVEKEVLMGAVDTIRRNNYPKIMFECWGGDAFEKKRNELFQYIYEIGYKRIVKVNGSIDMWLAEFY